MAKAKKKKDKRRREIINLASSNLPALHLTPRSVQDRRLYHPLGAARPLLTTSSRRPVLVVSQPKKQKAKPKGPVYRVQFAKPRFVLVCVRRNIRKQVLHALNKTGRGGQRRPRRNQWSEISCKG